MTAIEWTDETKTCSSCAEPKALDHISRATGAKPGPDRIPERDGDQLQARRTVNHLVEIGQLPRPNDLPCTDCGHVWSPGERRHEYDHHKGYGTGHHLDVEPVCTRCHHQREAERREVA